MAITPSNDSVTYTSPRGDVNRPADVVVAVNPDGTSISGSGGGTANTNITSIGGNPVTTSLPISALGVTPVNRSGTIAVAATAQQLMAANASRKGFWVQNVSSADLWINDAGTAAGGQPSMLIPAGALYESPETGVPTSAISIFGATLGQAFSAREW